MSIFVLELLAPFVEDRRLTPVGILATKIHAILDRGDWSAVKEYFLTRVGNLLVPPVRELKIQTLVVDVDEA